MSSSFTVTAFKQLRAQYPTWAELRAYLESEEGGRLRVVENPSDTEHVIVRYTKGTSNFTKEHVPLFRSVVWNIASNLPVAVAPPKANAGSPPEADGTIVQISDFVDGTMILGWQDAAGPRISTRTNITAGGTFYSQRPFAALFEDAIAALGGTAAFLRPVLRKGTTDFVAMVLQHCEHKTVGAVPCPRIFVTHTGSVSEDGTVTFACSPDLWPDVLRSYCPQLYGPPTQLGAGQASQLLVANQLGYSWQGLVIQDTTSPRRWRLRNPAFVFVRTLRGAEANPMARFLRLRATGQVKQYLTYFREESNTMWQFEQTLRQRTQELYDAYCDMHKARKKIMKDLPFCLRPHVYALHGRFLAAATAEGAGPRTSILKSSVVDYVNALAQEDQLRLLQGDHRPVAAQVVA